MRRPAWKQPLLLVLLLVFTLINLSPLLWADDHIAEAAR